MRFSTVLIIFLSLVFFQTTRANSFNNLTLEGTVVIGNHCSGSLIRFPHTLPSNRVLIVTNGHCLNMGSFQIGKHSALAPGETLENSSVLIRAQVLDSQGKPAKQITIRKVVFASMTNTDIAILEASETYSRLDNLYRLRAKHVGTTDFSYNGKAVLLSSYWQSQESCQFGNGTLNLQEGEWRFSRVVSHNCQTQGGASGSPVLDQLTGDVVALHFTRFSKTGALCSVNNPCEIKSDGTITGNSEVGYAQILNGLDKCFSANHVFNKNATGCMFAD